MKKLVLGIAFLGLGTLAMAQQKPAKNDNANWQEKRAEMQKKNDERRAQHLADMEKELSLTKTQVAQIKAIQDRNQAERKAEMQKYQDLKKQKMETMKRKKQDMDNEMRKILTPDQYAKWEAKKQANMEKRKEKMKQNKGNFGERKQKRMHNNINRQPAQ